MTSNSDLRGVSRKGHPGLVLSGEFTSPDHLLASDTLNREEKLEVLEQWERDLKAARSGGNQGTLTDDLDEFAKAIEDAKKTLSDH